jgi:hypothetical protein
LRAEVNKMTREQKIKSIVEAYAAVFEEEMKKGTMTTEKYVAFVTAKEASILAVIEGSNK